ncbi:MAG TPA: hydrogenase formation protein HypD [Flexistipes sinusarabici]|uniref:Hydrogenase formation protein HypD n=1 Tax=Flexistipes sinusarabici TaxID=2352 RepID=A0A3D5QB41_FLESI|nr:hydrogenase formation protein HypD [Flexistipes sinusarabici]
MKLITDFRNSELSRRLIEKIEEESSSESEYSIMEVCGTHTVSIFKYGIRSVLPENVSLISGPGCPVCVTSQGEIDAIFQILKNNDVSLLTFGDLMKVPGSSGENLINLRSEGKDIRVMLSPLDAVKTAAREPDREFVFVGIGFETTAPAIASAVLEAKNMGLSNFSILPFCKTMPEVLGYLLDDPKLDINGFLCPGHVSVVTGKNIYQPLAQKGKAAVITGFEPLDILSSILQIIRQVNSGDYCVYNNYSRVVSDNGNRKAVQIMDTVFEPSPSVWRGLGELEDSGLGLKEEFSLFNSLEKFNVRVPQVSEKKGCRCGEVLKGYIKPNLCPLFSLQCNPENPVGPCMVSSEGACAAYYKFN